MINRTFRLVSRAPWNLFKFGLGLALILFLLYIGMTIYVNSCAGNITVRMPDADEARYSVLIKNTGGILLTDKYTEHDSYVTLYGYWEKYDNKFKFRDKTKVLDERIFGDIEVKRRIVK